MSLKIIYTSTSRHGVCEECGKQFIRRVIDGNDDGRLCRDCYLKAKEAKAKPVSDQSS